MPVSVRISLFLIHSNNDGGKIVSCSGLVLLAVKKICGLEIGKSIGMY